MARKNLLDIVIATKEIVFQPGDKVKFKKEYTGYFGPEARSGKSFTVKDFIPRKQWGEKEDAGVVSLEEIPETHHIKVYWLEKVKAGVTMSLLNEVLASGKAEAHCYTTWHEGLRKLQEAQAIFDKAMGMAASENLPAEMKAQLAQFVADCYNTQAQAEELFEELREVDAGAPAAPKEEEQQDAE